MTESYIRVQSRVFKEEVRTIQSRSLTYGYKSRVLKKRRKKKKKKKKKKKRSGRCSQGVLAK